MQALPRPQDSHTPCCFTHLEITYKDSLRHRGAHDNYQQTDRGLLPDRAKLSQRQQEEQPLGPQTSQRGLRAKLQFIHTGSGSKVKSSSCLSTLQGLLPQLPLTWSINLKPRKLARSGRHRGCLRGSNYCGCSKWKVTPCLLISRWTAI